MRLLLLLAVIFTVGMLSPTWWIYHSGHRLYANNYRHIHDFTPRIGHGNGFSPWNEIIIHITLVFDALVLGIEWRSVSLCFSACRYSINKCWNSSFILVGLNMLWIFICGLSSDQRPEAAGLGSSGGQIEVGFFPIPTVFNNKIQVFTINKFLLLFTCPEKSLSPLTDNVRFVNNSLPGS